MNEHEVRMRETIHLRGRFARATPRIKLSVEQDPELESLLKDLEAAILIMRELTKEIALRGGSMVLQIHDTSDQDCSADQ